MPRKGPVPSREILPDPVYNSRLAARFINRLMYDGKKGVAEKLFYKSLETLGENAPELVADPDISPGGCLIQSPSSVVDATIEKRWARAVGNLGLSLDWNPEDADV